MVTKKIKRLFLEEPVLESFMFCLVSELCPDNTIRIYDLTFTFLSLFKIKILMIAFLQNVRTDQLVWMVSIVIAAHAWKDLLENSVKMVKFIILW